MEWIKNNFRQALLIAFITVVLSTVGSLVVYSITARDAKLDKSASTEYVDEHFNQAKVYINEKCSTMNTRVTTLENTMVLKADKSDQIRMEHKIDRVYELLVEIANSKSEMVKK